MFGLTSSFYCESVMLAVAEAQHFVVFQRNVFYGMFKGVQFKLSQPLFFFYHSN